nr:unnamed protein product [Digitaria exilis]
MLPVARRLLTPHFAPPPPARDVSVGGPGVAAGPPRRAPRGHLPAPRRPCRASPACTTFRRVISGRRFRSLRPAPVLGFLEFDAPGKFCPAEPPNRYAPAARGLAQFADFTFSFLPGGPIGWHVCDARVLLYRSSFTAYFVDLVVCDPLHRRYVQLAPIHDCRRGSVGELAFEDFDTFLDPATERDKEEQDLPSRVICAEHYQRKLVTYHFSSVTRKWCRKTFGRSTPLDPTTARFCPWFERQYVHSCFYWVFLGIGMGSLDILDTHEMKFYVLDQLPGGNAGPQALGIVEIGGGRLGINPEHS